MRTTAFLRGIGAGAVAGAVVGMVVMSRQGVMKTDVGKAMQRVGNAMDAAWYDIKHAMQ